MKFISTCWFFIFEAITSCRRTGVMTIITITTIAVTLLMMGVFLLATLNVESFLVRLQAEALVTAFLAQGTPNGVVNNVKMQVIQMDEVAQVDVITPDEAARNLFLDPADQKLLEVGMGSSSNPLPPTLRIKVRSNNDLEPLLKKLNSLSKIESVTYGEEAFRQFRGLSELLLSGSILISVLMGLSSLFIVFNTIRLTLFLRKEEVLIMRLVGATDWFIRWPFIIEGFIQGFLGAIVAVLLLVSSYRVVLKRLSILIPFFTFDADAMHLFKLCVKLGLMGIILGVSGSLLSVRDLRTFSKKDHE